MQEEYRYISLVCRFFFIMVQLFKLCFKIIQMKKCHSIKFGDFHPPYWNTSIVIVGGQITMVTTQLNLPNPVMVTSVACQLLLLTTTSKVFLSVSQFCLGGLLFVFGCSQPESPLMWLMDTVGRCAVCSVLPVHSWALQMIRQACSFLGVTV